jgi:hypothetical protein
MTDLKKVAVAYFKVIYWHSGEEIEENHENKVTG